MGRCACPGRARSRWTASPPLIVPAADD